MDGSGVEARDFGKLVEQLTRDGLDIVAGGGEAFLSRNDREIMTQLMVLVFGSEHRDKVVEALELMER